MRAELTRLVEASPLWDRKTLGLQVVDATDRTVVLRALVSAVDSGKCWELRCQVRERLLDFLRTRHPDCLPRIRAELDAPGGPRHRGAKWTDRASTPIGGTIRRPHLFPELSESPGRRFGGGVA